jgi:L-seryl-tRNA(Ser) seleniumtransferase
MGRNAKEILRTLPAVELILQQEVLQKAVDLPRSAIVGAAREVLQEIRDGVLSGGDVPSAYAEITPEFLAGRVLERAERMMVPRFRGVLNATGVVIHTNLGRSVLGRRAAEAVRTAATSFVNLEYDLDLGTRTTRQQHVEGLLREITGARAALVVNNNAGAVMLLANTMAFGREVIVSRGQLVEIGGSFRLPEVISASGAVRVEVGTTNRTKLEDYEAAIGPGTAMLLRVHPSNFVMSGFVAEVSLRDLVALGRRHNVPVVEDLGSGALVDMTRLGLAHETMPAESIAEGADAVTFSGDKLLGGSQAGIIVGSEAVVGKARGSPMARAVRIDKLNLAALEATLLAYRDPERAMAEIPTLRLIGRARDDIRASAERIADALKPIAGRVKITLEDGHSEVGGGASPDVLLPTVRVCLAPKDMSEEDLARRLRAGDPPVVVRVKDDRVWIDPRTLLPGEDEKLVAAVLKAVGPAR